MSDQPGSSATISGESKERHRATIDADLTAVLVALASDLPLDPRHQDHGLSADWAGYRDCHVKPDLVLIYAKPDDVTLRLARLGSHSEVFGECRHRMSTGAFIRWTSREPPFFEERPREGDKRNPFTGPKIRKPSSTLASPVIQR